MTGRFWSFPNWVSSRSSDQSEVHFYKFIKEGHILEFWIRTGLTLIVGRSSSASRPPGLIHVVNFPDYSDTPNLSKLESQQEKKRPKWSQMWTRHSVDVIVHALEILDDLGA